MITAKDLEYHTPPGATHEWAETLFLPVLVPEAHIYALVHVITRPALGVMTNDVTIIGALSDNRAELLYYDVRQHLPAPMRFSEITSPRGDLIVRAVDPPRRYRIDYVGYDDTEIHADWVGLMEPFDIHDPAQSIHADASLQRYLRHSGLKTGLRGHFDMSGRVTGTLTVRGKKYTVNSIDRMAHSWGDYDEMSFPSLTSISATLGEKLTFHAIAHLDLDAPTSKAQQLARGYVMQDGRAYAINDLELYTTRAGTIVTTMDMKVRDVRDRVFHLYAMADVGAPWMSYSGGISWNSMMRWKLGDRVGYGVVMEHLAFSDLHRKRARTWEDFPAAING